MTLAWWGALLGAVYVNGVELTPGAVEELRITGAAVVIDARGDVHIDAPGVVVPSPKLATPLDPGWWLLVEDQRSQRLTVSVYVNGALMKRVSSTASGDGGPGAVLVPLAGYVRSGVNDLRVEVTGDKPAGRMAVAVGRGVVQKGLPSFTGTPTRWLVGAELAGRPLDLQLDLTVP